MNPSNPQDRQHVTPQVPQRQSIIGPQIPARDNSTPMNVAAASIARTQLNSIYNGNTTTPTPQTTPVAQAAAAQPTEINQQSLETENPYTRTHSTHEQIQLEQWKQYHSAWQDYYRQYYERYYLSQVYQARQALEARAHDATQAAVAPPTQSPAPAAHEPLSRDEAMFELRGSLLGRMRQSAEKVRKSRHFVPITSAVGVILLFLFLQFNQI
ncbi:MAG TPA: hypothetical protein VIQ80_02900, partial [Candidatus Saccharimonadales bacterium]